MIANVLFITCIYFIIGAVAFFIVNKRSPDLLEKKARWSKYAVYLVMVLGIIAWIWLGTRFFPVLPVALSMIGATELFRLYYMRPRNKAFFLFSFLIYILFAAGFILYGSIPSREKLLYVYFVVFVFDGFSQVAGQLLGKIKLSPVVSPNKTVEGALGGILTACLSGILIRNEMHYSTFHAIFFSLILSAAALLGDLAASKYKRVFGVKDYSNIIPGHGGVLDRFDGYIAAGAVYWLLNILVF